MHAGCAKGRVGGCGGSNAPTEAKSSTSRRIAQRIRREVELLGLARTPGLDVDDLSSDRPKGAFSCRDGARPRHFAQQAGGGYRVTAEERTASPGLAIPPIRIPEVTQGLGPDHPIGQGLVWEQSRCPVPVCSVGSSSTRWTLISPI
jgi:hypothetical protein